ncbi:K+ channel tetramerization domain protein [Ancylostoma duodenale]|uniref:K+ channel tetramerization domain protein n=1 Tax=Ancylostoma duodenale TaxID=51022 RepID=A0A0C2H5M0_9BILA|nr:K+ channel tetramerization domain protein [Ancylostoma duodenale]
MDFILFKTDQSYVNLFVGGEVYPVQLKTLLNQETCGTFFKEKVVRVMEGIKWDTSPNHIKHRMDIDRDGLLFREVLQFIRNGKRTSIPENKYQLQQLVCEAEFFGLDVYRKMLRRRLWKLTGKAAFYACYSDSD